jgi:hypothetical protein
MLLLSQDGLVYYLVSEDLKQIDLSNDQLVAQLFGEGAWEQLMQPLYTQVGGFGEGEGAKWRVCSTEGERRLASSTS